MSDLLASPASSPGLDVERRAAIALLMVSGVGAGRAQALRRALGSVTAVFEASETALARVPGVGPRTAQSIAAFDGWKEVDEQLDRAERQGVQVIALGEAAYPAALAEIYDPPPVLWVRGRLAPEDARAVAVVGTRKASDYGRRVATALAGDLVRGGAVTIVSGLAYGIDAAAHQGALEAGGRTLAVLGSGVDVIYPRRNAGLVRQMLENDQGAVLSEFPLGTSPDAPHFPQRNRIISGLSVGTVVAEARETGGAHITAWMATEQNREVFAVPAPVFADQTGTSDLIRKGYARLVTSAAHVLEDLGGALAPANEVCAGDSVEAVPRERAELPPEEARLLEELGHEPVPLDRLCAAAEMDASAALSHLLALEFKGFVRQMAGKQFYRT